MRHLTSALLCVSTGLVAAQTPATTPAIETPIWAYPVSKPLPPIAEVPDAHMPQRVPGSPVEISKAQLRNLYQAPDWRPAGHPPMPAIVAGGRNPGVFACGFCHLPTGTGRPENANLTGLTVAYIQQQVADFKSGARKSSVAAMNPPLNMARSAANITDEELATAARYFASLPVRSFVSVVESATVPATEPRGWMLVATDTGATEPIGQRIIELAQEVALVELRDPEVRYIAHVPPGSIERGRQLAADSSRGAPCTSCHGADLKGLGDVPRLAGRSPTYLVRQMIDFVSGARNGPLAGPMVQAAKRLSAAERIGLAAYAASLPP
jgi:cytochrome c553